MRMTSRKKEILSYFEAEHLAWVTGEIGSPPFDVVGISFLLHPALTFNNKPQIESTRRTLEGMVKDGLLEKIMVHERRANRTQNGDGAGVRCIAARYGLPGQCIIVRDDDGSAGALNGEYVRIDD